MRHRRPFVLTSALAALLLPTTPGAQSQNQLATEAPAAFDGMTNGYVSQNQFETDRAVFEERAQIASGLGPVYNAQSCVDCHQNPVSGAISQVYELRAGHFLSPNFVPHPGGSLIDDRAIDPSLQERVLGGNEVRTFRTSLNLLGNGFVECVDSNTLVAIANAQPAALRGHVITVPVLEARGALRVGRFGWKNQHASLLSNAAEAYLDEMGITSPMKPTENTSNGRSVADFDAVPDPEDVGGVHVAAFTRFVRATKAPPRDAALALTAAAQVGSQLFNAVGCAICHVRAIVTAPPGTAVNGGTFVVPGALGDKRIHPLSDFLLHNVGTGDGIVQNGGQSTRNQVRTPPLWGLRTRNRLMHDGLSLTRHEAILRHAGQATGVIDNYRALSGAQKSNLITFLDSL